MRSLCRVLASAGFAAMTMNSHDNVPQMIKSFSLPLFQFSLPFPFLFYQAAQGMYQSFQTKIQSVGISDSTAWSTGAHMSSRNYSITQDTTVEFLVLLTHFLCYPADECRAAGLAAGAAATCSVTRATPRSPPSQVSILFLFRICLNTSRSESRPPSEEAGDADSGGRSARCAAACGAGQQATASGLSPGRIRPIVLFGPVAWLPPHPRVRRATTRRTTALQDQDRLGCQVGSGRAACTGHSVQAAVC